MANAIETRGIEFIQTIRAVDDERGFGTEFIENMSEWLGKFRVVDTRELNIRAGRVGKRTENVEDGALANFLARANGIFHCRVEFGGEHEANSNLLNGLG